MTRPAERALAAADIRIMGRAGGRAEETGTARGMQGSSSPALPLLYSTAVTVRFFDAVALALFACELGFPLFLKERRSLTAVCKRRRLGTPRSRIPGSARALACWFARRAEARCFASSHPRGASHWRGASASTR